MQISFRANIPSTLNSKYTSEKSKENTVTVLGSSRAADSIMDYMEMCANSTKALVLSGKNLVHGCGTDGIMGEAYRSGLNYSKKNKEGKPVQNLAILTKPLWGNEDLEHCIPIVETTGEADRIEKFAQVSNTMLIFPGSAGTMQEATTLISKNYYGKPEDKKKIILVGSEFFKGLIEQYDKLYESKLIKTPPSELFTVADSEEEILNIINGENKK